MKYHYVVFLLDFLFKNRGYSFFYSFHVFGVWEPFRIPGRNCNTLKTMSDERNKLLH